MTQTFGPDIPLDERSNDLDVGALGAVVYRKRFWILIPTVIAFLLAAVFVTMVKPRYTAQTQILLENQEASFTRPQRAEVQAETPESFDEEFMSSQVDLVASGDLARRVIAKLGLVRDPEFDPLAKGLGPVKRTLVLFGLIRNPLRIPLADRVLDTFEQKLSVFSPQKTHILTIQFSSHDPVLAAQVANEVADVYLEMQSEAKRDVAKAAASSLSAEISDLKTRVTPAADEVERYRARSGLLGGTNNMTISGQQLADLNTELSHARTAQADGQAKAALIRQMLHDGRVAEVPDVANNDLIRRIAEQLVTAKAQLALESGTLLPEHPRIKELNAEIAALNAQLRIAGESIARALENDSAIAAARVANINAAIDQQKKTVVIANADEVHLHELERAAQALRDQLDSDMTKYQEAVMRVNSTSTPANARVIARAIPPDEPAFPKKLPTLIFGTVAGFVLSLGAVVGAELFANRPVAVREGAMMPPRVVEDVERRPSSATPALERVRRFGRSRAASSADTEISDEEESADEPPEKIAALADAPQGVHIVATRLRDSEKTTAALIGFARNLARDGRPIIVDLALGSDQMAPLIGLDAPSDQMLGLTDLLHGKASFADVIHRDQASRLHFVPFGSAEAFDPNDLDIILDALAQTYDFVLLAAPPLATSEMSKALAPYADFVVLATPGESDAAATKTACADLKSAGAAEILVIDGAREAA